MGDVSSGPGGVLYNTPDGPSGLFMALDPGYQAKQQQVQQNAIGLSQAQAFKDGFPTDQAGNPDWGAASLKSAQLGDYASADKFQTIALQQNAIATAQRNASGVGQYGGGQGGGPLSSGMLGGGAAGGAQPAAGGGMIAPGAGGDNYGRMQSAPAAPPAAGGQPGASSSAPGDYLSRLAMVENGGKDGGDPSAAGALGRYQFTASTWNGLAKQYPDLGLTADGRTDPAQQQRAIQAFTNDNISALGRSGIQATPGSLYLAHFAGAGGATAALKADPNTPVSSILGAAAVKANPFLDGMTAGGLVGWANGKMAGVDPSTVPGTPGGISPEVASAIVRLRTGQGSAADGATLRAYQASKAQGGAPGQPQPDGQASPPTSAPTGGQAQPISFGGMGASSSPASGGATSAGQPPVSDDMYATAQRVVSHFENADPRSMTPDQQRAVTMSTGLISRYEAAQASPPDASAPSSAGTVAGAPTSSTQDAPKPGAHPYFPGGSGMKSAPATPTVGQGQPQAPGGAMPVSFGAAPPAMAPGQPMPSPGRQPPQAGGMLPGAPPMAPGPGPQGGGQQLASFGGGAPQGGAPTPSGMPPEVGAALQRLQSRQGSAADGQILGAYQRSVGQGGSPSGVAAMPSAPQDGQGQPVSRPAPVPTQPTVPPRLPPATSTQALDPSFGGLVPAAWLQAGHSAGDWVGYARSQAAINGALPYGAGKANEEGWTKIADGLSGAIDKSNVFTPEQRNARDPAAVQYEQNRADYNAMAPILAKGSPQGLAAARDEAGATAAGTAAGGAPYKFVPTTPVAGGPTVYTSEADLAAGNGGAPAVKDQPGVFGQKQEALGKLDGEMQGQFQQRQVAQERLDAMSNLLETFQSGAGADAKAAAVAAVRAAGFNMPDTATASPAAVEQFTKNATANVFSNAKDMGGRVLVSELDGLQKANANPNMQPGSNAAIIAQQKGLLNWEDAHYQAYSGWRNANPYATDASAFEQGWAKQNPVGAYVSAARKDIAPLGQPLPSQGQLVDGQAYIVQGQKTRYDAGSGQFVPFSGTTAPTLPGQSPQGSGGQGQSQAQGQRGTPPIQGARQARDGNWYVADPSRAGKFLMVSR